MTRPGPAERLRRLLAHPSLHGAIALAALLALFFETPLSRYREVHYSSADLTQDFCLTKVQPGHEVGNRLLSDAVTQMQPWLMFNRDELAEGRFPLWNPWNGGGCPHFANYQAAVLSPYSLPYYLLDYKAALLSSAFLKLYTLGLFTYLFLRRVRVSQVPAIAGGAAFMFGGHNVVLLSFPHVPALIALPAGLYCVEVALQRWSGARAAGERARLALPLTGLFAALASGLLAGNPEPFYFATVLLALYTAARLAWLAREVRRGGGPLGGVAALAGKIAFAAVLAAGFGAVQVLPFFEFLQNSRVIEERTMSRVQTPLDPEFWPMAFFPDVIGNPSTIYNLGYHIPPPNYELVNMAYSGATVLFLAGLSLLFVRRNRRIAFFAVAAAVWACYAYDFFGASHWISYIPTVSIAPMNRSQGLWNFCLAVLAAFALDELVKRRPDAAPVRATATALVAGAFVFVFLVGADRLIEGWARAPSPNHHLFPLYVPGHVRYIGRAFALGAGAIVLLWLIRWSWARSALAAACVLSAFLQTGWHLRDYNPVSEDRFFFPRTEAIAQLERHVGDRQLAIFGEDQIPPTSNLAYRLSLVQNYDGLWVREYDHLYRSAFGDSNNWRPILKASERMLQVFGAEYVLAKWGWIPVDSALSKLERSADVQYVRNEITPGREVAQTFLSHEPDLQAVAVFLACYPRTKHCTLVFKLVEEDTGELVCEQRITSEDVRSTIFVRGHVRFASEYQTGLQGRHVVFRFEPRPDSRGKRYRFVLSVPDGSPSDTISTYSTNVLAYGEGHAYHGRDPLPGEVLFDFSHCYDSFEQVAQVEEFVLYRFKESLGRYHVVGGAVIAESDREALGILRVPTYDPRRLVVLQTDDPSAAAASTAMGPRDNSSARLVKRADSVKVYLVSQDGTSIVHIEDEATFLANKFRWDQIETIPDEEFDRFRIVDYDLDAERKAGLRVVAPPEEGAMPPEVLEESPTRIRVAVERENPGYLVVTKAHFPGWKARVNGEERPLFRANYAFDAVELRPGRNEVELAYEPASVRNGLAISCASALLGLAALARGLRRRV